LQSELTKKESQWREEATVSSWLGNSYGNPYGWRLKAGKIIGKKGKTMEQHNK
jgi:hypothetical protein